MTARRAQQNLRALADPAIAEHSQRFFKTGKGEYGEGDRFLGIRVPILRKQAKNNRAMSLAEIRKLLKSRFHEERLCALFLLVHKFAKGDEEERTAVYDTYMTSTAHINNWDLVDSSAHLIVGPYLEKRSRRPLYRLAKSALLWERRIAVMATLHFIKGGEFDVTLDLARRLLHDKEDLMHKSVGWMLREIGNRDREVERAFLREHAAQMPRTMLRYAIEKFPERERQRFLKR